MRKTRVSRHMAICNVAHNPYAERKLGRHDADDRVGVAVQQNLFADRIHPAAESRLPQAAAQDHDSATAFVVERNRRPMAAAMPRMGSKSAARLAPSTCIGSPCPIIE